MSGGNPSDTERINALEDRMQTLESLVRENTRITKENGAIAKDIAELMNLWRDGLTYVSGFGRGLARLGSWITKTLIFFGKVAAAIAAIWAVIYALRTGIPPGPK